MRVGRGPLNQTTGCCTWRWIGPVGVEDKVDWHAMEVANKSRKEGTKMVSTIVSDPPQARGVKAVSEMAI